MFARFSKSTSHPPSPGARGDRADDAHPPLIQIDHLVKDPAVHSLQETIEVLPLIMGALALLLSGALVTNTMSALLAQQIDQIGMLKAIGADTRLIRRIYNQTVLAYGLLGLAIGDRLRANSAIGWRVSWQPISISTSARRALPGWHWV